jgi:anti-sigma B factor antagonist
MEIITAQEDGKNILQVKGRLDATTSPSLEKELLTLLDSGEKDFIADLSGLEYISSVGLRILLMVMKKARAAGGKLAVSSLTEHVQEVFEIAGFTSILPIYKSLDEAISNY